MLLAYTALLCFAFKCLKGYFFTELCVQVSEKKVPFSQDLVNLFRIMAILNDASDVIVIYDWMQSDD